MSDLTPTLGKVLKDYYRLCLVIDQRIYSTDQGYLLTFKVKGSKEGHVLWKTRGAEPRFFTSLDTVIDYLKAAGGLSTPTTLDFNHHQLLSKGSTQ